MKISDLDSNYGD